MKTKTVWLTDQDNDVLFFINEHEDEGWTVKLITVTRYANGNYGSFGEYLVVLERPA